jgi:chorismate dehydratase
MMLGKLGRMAFVNTLPVDWGLAESSLGNLAEIRRGTPTLLNDLLAKGELDVSAVSSVAAAEHAEDWLVLDHLCIGCKGEVGSVILHADRPVERLRGRTIACTSESATAVRLLRILLERYWKIETEFVGQSCRADARLLIGDSALKAAQSNGPGFIYDLGREWKEFTGHDFVFGLWCVRRDFAAAYPEETRALYHLLETSYAMGRAEMSSVIAKAAAVTGLDTETIREYFPKLVYELDEDLWAGLGLFLRLLGRNPDRLETFGIPKYSVPRKIAAACA